MGLLVSFIFRNKPSLCIIYIDSSTAPCYVFIDLKEGELIHEFGEEITVKTDFYNRLPKKDDYPALVELREAIFNAMKHLPEFLAKRRLGDSMARSHQSDGLTERARLLVYNLHVSPQYSTKKGHPLVQIVARFIGF